MLRRQFNKLILGYASHILISGCSTCGSHSFGSIQKCSLFGTTSDEISKETTTDDRLERMLSREIGHIERVFTVNPGIVFTPNRTAYATSENFVSGKTGTVVLGVPLIWGELRRNDWGGVAVSGILAHEFAHIYQFSSPTLINQLGCGHVKANLVELHADFMAGYYLGLKRRNGDLYIKAFVDSLYLKGDTDISSPSHHGTPLQRERIMIRGYRYGLQGYVQPDVAAREGLKTLQTGAPST